MFDRAEFEAEMERLKEIPVLMNEEWKNSAAIGQAQRSQESGPDDTNKSALPSLGSNSLSSS